MKLLCMNTFIFGAMLQKTELVVFFKKFQMEMNDLSLFFQKS